MIDEKETELDLAEDPPAEKPATKLVVTSDRMADRRSTAADEIHVRPTR